MIQPVLGLVALVAFLNGAIGLVEWIGVAAGTKATVFQEISSRLNIGMSILIFTIAAGSAAVIGRTNLLIIEHHRLRSLLERNFAAKPVPSEDAPQAELDVKVSMAHLDDKEPDTTLQTMLVVIGVLFVIGLFFAFTR